MGVGVIKDRLVQGFIILRNIGGGGLKSFLREYCCLSLSLSKRWRYLFFEGSGAQREGVSDFTACFIEDRKPMERLEAVPKLGWQRACMYA